MPRRLIASSVVLTLMLTLTGAPGLAAAAQAGATQTQSQTPPPQTAPPGSSSSTALPVDVNKIRAVVGQAPTPLLSYEGMRARFYARVTARNDIHFTDFIGTFDLRNGPVPRAGQTHAEFLAMVTPKELYSAAGIKPTEELQMVLTGFLAQMLARKAIDEIRKATSDREIQTIRDRISKELAALTGVK